MDITENSVIIGNKTIFRSSFAEFSEIKCDLDLTNGSSSEFIYSEAKTIKREVSVSSYGTFCSKKTRTITFSPCKEYGWFFKRSDIANYPLIKLTHENVVCILYGGVNNIVLLTQEKKAFIRLIEHIIALRMGTDIDSLIISCDSFDPPLFDDGSIPLLDSLNSSERIGTGVKTKYVTVKQKVIRCRDNGAFLIFNPPENIEDFSLKLDCAINFENVIGTQRLKLIVNEANFKIGAEARTNASLKHALLCKSIGKLFKATRNLGYNRKNLMVYGNKKYITTPKLLYNGKYLEAIWHRTILDLLAAVALFDGRFIGNIVSYKANHSDDVSLLQELYSRNLIEEVMR